MLLKSWNSSSDECIYKCMTFDMHDKDAAYVLYRICQTWQCKRTWCYHTSDGKDDTLETKDLYVKVKSFGSKEELDMWCAVNNVEKYDIVSCLDVIELK